MVAHGTPCLGPIARPGVHVLLDRDADLIGTLHPGRSVNTHRLSSSPGHGLVAVRPDGYIGFRSRTADVSQLTAWLARLGAGGFRAERGRGVLLAL